MEYKDYYKVLGVPRTATEKEIRDAYRKLARKHHPDVNPNDKRAEERFKEIGESYAVLSDPAKRRKYDQVGPQWDQFVRGAGFGRPSGSPFGGTRGGAGRTAGGTRVDLGDLTNLGGGLGDLGGFSDFFESLFGQGATQQPRTPPAAANEEAVEITLAEAYAGVEREIEAQVAQPCPLCNGTGRYKGAPCFTCSGTGRQQRPRRLRVKIPGGVDTGSRVVDRSSGQGDLTLVVTVLPDPTFRREGVDLYCDIPVELTRAILGGEVGVPTPGGKKLMLKLPPESANGQQFVLRGQGMPRLQGEGRGNLYARLNVVLPRNLTPREREIFQELERSRSTASAAC